MRGEGWCGLMGDSDVLVIRLETHRMSGKTSSIMWTFSELGHRGFKMIFMDVVSCSRNKDSRSVGIDYHGISSVSTYIRSRYDYPTG